MSTTRARLGVALAVLIVGVSACGGGGNNTSSGFRVQTGGTGANGGPQSGVGAAGASTRTTFLLSKGQDGFPNGPSRNAAVSHDQRIARYIAYESDASNIVDGDTNGTTDVFLVIRAKPFGARGTPWQPAGTILVSKGQGGAPANGPSYRPALDGDSHHVPHCVAFVSAASNLVPGDTNGKPDGFVYDIRTQRITRVTVNSAGQQSNGSTYDISITGDCQRVAFTSDAGNLALTRASKAAWTGATTSAVTPGTHQVYVRVIGGSGLNAGFKGLTFLASASSKGAAGNANSDEANIARSGKAVVFSSTSTNLAKGDKTVTADVYRRTIFRKFQHLGNGKGVQTLQGVISLVSATKAGRAGNGASTHPTVTDDGRYVAYQTDASNLLPGDTNGVTDIARADLNAGRPKQEWVSKTKFGIGNGASHDPVISDAGEFILFDSAASNLRPSAAVRPDPNGVEDVFLWNAPTRNVSLESRDADNGYLYAPSQHPATSSRGNYVPFESADPLIDLPLASELFPKLVAQPSALDLSSLPQLSNPDVAAPELPHVANSAGFKAVSSSVSADEAAKAAADAGQQVYLRYLGSK
jgi:Tol biopolymer transport system component